MNDKMSKFSTRAALAIAIGSYLFLTLTGCERDCYRAGAAVTATDSIISGKHRYSEVLDPIVWDCDQVIEGNGPKTVDTAYQAPDTLVLTYTFTRFSPRP